ncbi:MAG: prolyl oligopeptidase family serine peptidase [Adhaeribacter sp.]
MVSSFPLLLAAGLMLALALPGTLPAQSLPNASPLSIDQIMQGNAFIGTSPSNVTWSEDGRKLYFSWNPENNRHDSLYTVGAGGGAISKVSRQEALQLPAQEGSYNRRRTLKVYEKNGDIFLLHLSSGKVQQLTHTTQREDQPAFAFQDQQITYVFQNNLYLWSLAEGSTRQLTDFRKGQAPAPPGPGPQEAWLRRQQLQLLEVNRLRETDRRALARQHRQLARLRPKEIYTGDKSADNLVLSPDGRYVTYRLVSSPATGKATQVPSYVTASGFTELLPARSKVGGAQPIHELGVYDRQRDTTFLVSFSQVPGIRDTPAFKKAQAGKPETTKQAPLRAVSFTRPLWSDDGRQAVLVLRARDNKDRWILAFNPASQSLRLLDRQQDEAWIGGPGIGEGPGAIGWLPDHARIWFQSEESGYSHLYTLEVATGRKKALTSGSYEVSNLRLSANKKYWYFNANRQHPGEVQFYRLPVAGGKAEQLTSGPGYHEVSLSPDERTLALRHSTATQPWELYLMANRPGAPRRQVTHSQRPAFQAYAWRKPEVVSFPAEDGVPVYARLYRPAGTARKKPAVIFVHGAGYLQNAHTWWSQYSREYLFHNLLVDHGYTVLDIDYRGSAGYGRDFRTGIYRHMGGKDLGDHLSGARLLVEKYGVDPGRIGIYGGSYGGFITLMAMFTRPGVFAAGAALRPVTDWAHYNHGYTANILNEPVTDSLAYARSSPIYFADGLQGALLICHGLVDVNVHAQDVLRLSQRLIELGKENWELALYPVEDHAFVAPSSWADEYKRIFKLFETNLKKGL